MVKNVGGIDKIVRIILGAVLVVLAAMGIVGWWGYLGVILLITGFINFCPLYRLIRFSSRK